MWHEKETSCPIDNSELVTDSCPTSRATSGHQKSFSHGTEEEWKKHASSSASMKGYPDSEQCLYDSGRTDSGFLSGANLVSSGYLSDETSATSSRKYGDSFNQDSASPGEEKDFNSSMRIDSGIDVGLNDNFLGLSLKNTSLNNLNITSKPKYPRSEESTKQFTNINVTSPSVTSLTEKPYSQTLPASEQLHPSQDYANQTWQLYFQQDEDGDTQLHIAIIQGFLEVVFSLIRMVPSPSYLDILNDVCQTPLHLAVLTGQDKIVRRLLVAGVRVTIQDRDGNTALHLACISGDMKCFKALTEPVTVAETANASLQYTTYAQQVPQDLEKRNYDGQMCVHLAATGDHVEPLRHLIWFGADINAREAKSGRTILHYAVERKLTKVTRFLLDECPIGPSGLHLETPTYAGYTAYQLAECIDPLIAEQLVARGANVPPKREDSESESDSSDDEMYQAPSATYLTHFRNNGEAIQASA